MAEQRRCILEAAAGDDHQDRRCDMSTNSRSVTSLFYPYVGKFMRIVSPLTVAYNVGDPLCSSHYNHLKRLRTVDLDKMQSAGDVAMGSNRPAADKRKTSLVQYFQSIRPDEHSSTEDGSVLQQLNLLIHTSICVELMSHGFIRVSKAREKIKALCLKHVESTTDDAVRKRTERLLYDDAQSKTSLLSFISDISFVKVAAQGQLSSSSSAKIPDAAAVAAAVSAVDPERSYMRYDGFEASPDRSSNLTSKLKVNTALLLQVCLSS